MKITDNIYFQAKFIERFMPECVDYPIKSVYILVDSYNMKPLVLSEELYSTTYLIEVYLPTVDQMLKWKLNNQLDIFLTDDFLITHRFKRTVYEKDYQEFINQFRS